MPQRPGSPTPLAALTLEPWEIVGPLGDVYQTSNYLLFGLALSEFLLVLRHSPNEKNNFGGALYNS